MAWNNGPLALYHGSNTIAFQSATGLAVHIPFAIDWNACRDFTDFGKAFYTTTSPHQAREWANKSIRFSRGKRGTAQTRAAIIRFDVDREELASLAVLAFVRDTADFYYFVHYCRSRGIPHGRNGPQNAYDVVYGPVALRNQQLIIQDSDQVSFHTQAAADCLCRNGTVVHDIATAANGLLP